MENKYYTPKMSDFHLGFEFEEKIAEDIWHPRTFLFKWFKEDIILKLLDKNKIRVKHLDREDIESLKWKYISKYEYKKEKTNHLFNYELYISKNNQIIYINHGQRTLFEGAIKNKSELKKIMQMLNIEVDGKS